MNKSGYFLISILVFSGLALMASTAPVQAQDDNVITITAEAGAGNVYDKTSIDLEVGVEYTIVFKNDQEMGHNLRIDTNDNIEDNGDVSDSDDVVIGLANDATVPESGWTGSWNATVTFDEDSEIIFYCGFPGHYEQGMEGVFVIGEGDAPAPSAFLAFSAILLAALAIPRLRKR